MAPAISRGPEKIKKKGLWLHTRQVWPLVARYKKDKDTDSARTPKRPGNKGKRRKKDEIGNRAMEENEKRLL